MRIGGETRVYTIIIIIMIIRYVLVVCARSCKFRRHAHDNSTPRRRSAARARIFRPIQRAYYFCRLAAYCQIIIVVRVRPFFFFFHAFRPAAITGVRTVRPSPISCRTRETAAHAPFPRQQQLSTPPNHDDELYRPPSPTPLR